MASTGFSIACPDDAGMMDFVGFDASTPQALAAFARGEL
jgi:60 kDa SS-A/Ro ribonucleoprotein